MITYKIAATKSEYEEGKRLFEEYANTLNVDLSFQNFSQELQGIDRQYSKPDGALLLVYDDSVVIACVGIRLYEQKTAELKRMYVKPEYRGRSIGLLLLQQAIMLARDLGYEKLRLDTLHNMTRAQHLYHSHGFYEIAPYRFNPLAGTIFMEKDLREDET